VRHHGVVPLQRRRRWRMRLTVRCLRRLVCAPEVWLIGLCVRLWLVLPAWDPVSLSAFDINDPDDSSSAMTDESSGRVVAPHTSFQPQLSRSTSSNSNGAHTPAAKLPSTTSMSQSNASKTSNRPPFSLRRGLMYVHRSGCSCDCWACIHTRSLFFRQMLLVGL